MGQLQNQRECSEDEINLKINSFGVLHYVSRPTVTDTLTNHSVFTFTVKQSLLGWLDSSECQLIIYQSTWSSTPEDFNLQEDCCKHLKPHTQKSLALTWNCTVCHSSSLQLRY
jgi:hypothetical protein